MTMASTYLLELGRRNAEAYIAHTQPRAILATGSACSGESDLYSDLDTIMYYEALPSDESLVAAREQNQGSSPITIAPRSETSYSEAYDVAGVQCQIVHVTVAAWERDMAQVMKELEVTSPVQKALSGLLEGIPLYGPELIAQWKEEVAAYPDELATAMMNHYLQFTPFWFIEDHLLSRDATVWLCELIVQSAYNILGVLAGLNRLYYSTFQFKRMHAYVAKMRIAPADLAGRLESLFTTELAISIREVEKLVQETVALVREHAPDVDVAHVRYLNGERQKAWQPRSTGSPE